MYVTVEGFTGDSELVVGSVRGIRLFHCWDDQVRAWNFDYVWTGQENEAECGVPIFPATDFVQAKDRTVVHPKNDSANEAWGRLETTPHDLTACTCGLYAFYTYLALQHEFGAIAREMIYGIVEGYGETVLGSRGFRASKARIVALVAEPTLGMARAYPNVEYFSTVGHMIAKYPLDIPTIARTA